MAAKTTSKTGTTLPTTMIGVTSSGLPTSLSPAPLSPTTLRSILPEMLSPGAPAEEVSTCIILTPSNSSDSAFRFCSKSEANCELLRICAVAVESK